MNPQDIAAIWLTLKVAGVTTLLLFVISIPLAWWLARTRSSLKAPISAIVAVPLVLPPSVLGFYLLLAMGPEGPIGWFTQQFGLGLLPFTFEGLVIASMFYSLPFVVQPLQAGFEKVDDKILEAAATLGAKPWDRFISIAVAQSRGSFVVAAILGFAHTVGEFGVVLMVGGNIPGETSVLSVQIYEHVEALDYERAHMLSLILVAFSFLVLTWVYWLNRGSKNSQGLINVQ